MGMCFQQFNLFNNLTVLENLILAPTYLKLLCKEEAIKRRYGVDKVYMPDGVIIKKVTTYDRDVDSNEEVYEKIVKLKQFTIEGVVITIKNKEVENYKTKYIYIL